MRVEYFFVFTFLIAHFLLNIFLLNSDYGSRITDHGFLTIIIKKHTISFVFWSKDKKINNRYNNKLKGINYVQLFYAKR